ncbi:MAG: hypothetical protein CMO01_13645 [Thalassobius sp.]|nr:hypothetical protein [Thalassovita sp.]
MRSERRKEQKQLKNSQCQMDDPDYKDKDAEIAALKKALQQKEKELNYAKMKHKALDILIEIAEERFDIIIKKSLGLGGR